MESDKMIKEAKFDLVEMDKVKTVDCEVVKKEEKPFNILSGRAERFENTYMKQQQQQMSQQQGNDHSSVWFRKFYK